MATKLILACKIFLLVVSSFLAYNVIAATNTLNQGTSLNSTTTLVSQNGLFTLGFQRLGTAESNSSYLAIWYDGDASEPFWIANRESPISDDSGELEFDASGNLRIIHSGGDPIILFSSRSAISNLVVVLQDAGNLELKESTSSNDQTLWQSFDFPSDSLLPGMKLGTKSSTGQNWQVTSWLGDSIPTMGSFTLEWDPQAGLVVKRRGIVFWSSGKLLDDKDIEHFYMSGDIIDFIYTNFSNVDGNYFSYSVQKNDFTPQDWNNFSFWRLRYDGSIVDNRTRRLPFSSENCDGSTTEYGCVRWEGPACRGQGVKFELRSGWFTNTAPQAIDNNVSLGIGDCKEICWRDCNCIATTTANYNNNTGCQFFYGGFNQDLRGGVPTKYFVIFKNETERRTWIWILIAVAFVLIVTITGILLYLRRRKMKEKMLNDFFKIDTKEDETELEIEEDRGHNLKIYSVQSILVATNGFSMQNKLGQGGFGPVYKGTLPDGREVAVKRLSRSSGQGLVEFKNELVLIAKLQHSNLVRLLGCCIQGEEKMLVYEYMPNKSLDSFIFDDSKKMKLDWKRRYNIIEGIAQGMLYLHKYSRLRIIHRDLKVSNILLDHDMNPKISDFGMAKIFKTNELEANTNRVVGTYGYMSPEYAMEGKFSEKSDVFSFGVLVLEIISGRKNYGLVQVDPPLNLVGFTWELWKEGRPLELLDPSLRDSCSNEQVLKCIQLGLLCVEESAFDRPTMSNVISMLSSTSDVSQLLSPNQPAFSHARKLIDLTLTDSSAANAKPEEISLNEVDLSDISAR